MIYYCMSTDSLQIQQNSLKFTHQTYKLQVKPQQIYDDDHFLAYFDQQEIKSVVRAINYILVLKLGISEHSQMIKPQYASLNPNHTSQRREVSDLKSKINLQQLRKVQAINHKLISRKSQLLPEIASPYLKKTIHSLFFNKNSPQLSPIKRYNNQGKFIDAMTHQISNLKAIQQNKVKTVSNKNDQPCETINLDVEVNLSKKIGKSFSEAKKFSSGVEDIKKLRGHSPSRSINKSKMIIKIPTESSLHSDQSPKQIYQRLKELNQRDRLLNGGEEKYKSKEKEGYKEAKKSIFAVKHKITQQLYSDEREQIKLAKNMMNQTNQMNLGRSLQIKNYTKFFPNIISIESL